MSLTNPMRQLKQRLQGFTLIEMVLFIVVVGVGLAGVLTVLNITTKSSADPIQPKQALLVAESMMEEILLKSYCDPDTVVRTTTPSTCGVHTTEATRDLYDDVLDYNGYTSACARSLDDLGNCVSGLSNYSVSVSVASETVKLLAGWQVAVSVTVGGNTYTLTSYRFNYD